MNIVCYVVLSSCMFTDGEYTRTIPLPLKPWIAVDLHKKLERTTDAALMCTAEGRTVGCPYKDGRLKWAK